jgi:hypothetical protein
VQLAPDAVQTLAAPPPPPDAQQTWVSAPQATPAAFWHDPLVHVPVVPAPPLQAVPAARHCPPTQHPPPLQVLAAQHAWPAPPHGGPPAPGVVVLLLQATRTTAIASTPKNLGKNRGSSPPVPRDLSFDELFIFPVRARPRGWASFFFARATLPPRNRRGPRA